MAASNPADWLIPSGLIALALIPIVAGLVRLTLLANLQTDGGPLTPRIARFFDLPIPVVLHIVSVIIYSLLGAFQFASGFRRRRHDWHRAAGRVLVVAGLVAALTGSGWRRSTRSLRPTAFCCTVSGSSSAQA